MQLIIKSYLNGTVILVDLNAEFSTGCEVVRLGKVTFETVMFHGIHVVFHANESPLVLVGFVLVAWPDFLEVWNNVISPEK